jgi:hypothetical protein
MLSIAVSPSLHPPNTKESPEDALYRARGEAGFRKGVEAMDSAVGLKSFISLMAYILILIIERS